MLRLTTIMRLSLTALFAAVLLAFACESAAADTGKKPVIVLISGEYEYQSRDTLPAFKKYLEAHYPVECVYLERPVQTNLQTIPMLEVLKKADLAILYIRRMTLPEAELNQFKAYVDAGKPLIGLRTASHAFENWKAWDHDVLGGNYHNHSSKKLVATAEIIPAASGHPILKGVARKFATGGSLYRNQPLPEGSVPLMMGSIEGEPAEPVAWTHAYKNGRIFYTSLGHIQDFENESFKRLLVNAIYWGLDRPVPAPSKPAAKEGK
jgi:type 1 glutamine amidotransferase